jgi:hypothetical protein
MASKRANAAPSPPLFPFPQNMTIDFPATLSPSRAVTHRTVAIAAFSISVKEGTPYRSVVRRSMSRICTDEITGCTG